MTFVTNLSLNKKYALHSPFTNSPGISRPTNPGPGPSPGSRILEWQNAFCKFGSSKSKVLQTANSDPRKKERSYKQPKVNFEFESRSSSQISGTGTAGSRGPCPGCRSLISSLCDYKHQHKNYNLYLSKFPKIRLLILGFRWSML